jgi:hypothetical protein
VGLPPGAEGAYFVGHDPHSVGSPFDPSILDANAPPSGQPGLWCQWIPTDDGRALTWSGGEKFTSPVEWLQYLIDHFLEPWGYRLNGVVEWTTREHPCWSDDDLDFVPCVEWGTISVKENVITTTRESRRTDR